MSKYTKGPWSAFIKGGTIAVDIGPLPTGQNPCIITWGGFDGNDLPKSQNIANARLISAAPDLLAALQAFVREATDYHKSCGHGKPGATAQCDSICACLPLSIAALKKAGTR